MKVQLVDFYRPQTKLGEDNVFIGNGGGVSLVPCHFRGCVGIQGGGYSPPAGVGMSGGILWEGEVGTHPPDTWG